MTCLVPHRAGVRISPGPSVWASLLPQPPLPFRLVDREPAPPNPPAALARCWPAFTHPNWASLRCVPTDLSGWGGEAGAPLVAGGKLSSTPVPEPDQGVSTGGNTCGLSAAWGFGPEGAPGLESGRRSPSQEVRRWSSWRSVAHTGPPASPAHHRLVPETRGGESCSPAPRAESPPRPEELCAGLPAATGGRRRPAFAQLEPGARAARATLPPPKPGARAELFLFFLHQRPPPLPPGFREED